MLISVLFIAELRKRRGEEVGKARINFVGFHICSQTYIGMGDIVQ